MSTFRSTRRLVASLRKTDDEALTSASSSLLQEAQRSADAAIDTHEAASDPHPGYLTEAEADALYAPLGGGVSDGDKGDVEVTSSGAVWTVEGLQTVPVSASAPATADRLRYSGTQWEPSAKIWQPLTNGDATTPELIFAAGDVVMVEV